MVWGLHFTSSLKKIVSRMKILFLAANPINVVSPLRIDKEFREISQKIRLAPFGSQVELVPELAVKACDLQHALLTHRPDIVHFSGHCSPSSGIILEDEDGNGKVVSREALAEMFRIRKGNVRVVVLNACYSKDQAQALNGIIDFTIGMDGGTEDRAAIVFAPRFYQSLACGCSVKEAFEMAANQLALEGIEVAQAPVLLEREGTDAGECRVFESSPGVSVDHRRRRQPFALAPWTLAGIALSLSTDMLRRFVGDGWPEIASGILEYGFVLLAIVAGAMTLFSMVRPANSLVARASGLGMCNAPRKSIIVTATCLVAALGLWLSLPAFAHYYNERGVRFQYGEQSDQSRARESYQQAVRLNPSYAQAHYNLAGVQEELLPEKAIEEYLLAIRYDSHIYPAYNNLAHLYLRRGKENDFEIALDLLSRASDSAPHDENVQYSLSKNLGWANYGLKHYAIAEMYLRRAIALRGEQGGAAAHCLLAHVLKEQGKAGVMDECFDCVSLAPGEADVEAKWLSDAKNCLMKGGGR